MSADELWLLPHVFLLVFLRVFLFRRSRLAGPRLTSVFPPFLPLPPPSSQLTSRRSFYLGSDRAPHVLGGFGALAVVVVVVQVRMAFVLPAPAGRRPSTPAFLSTPPPPCR